MLLAEGGLPVLTYYGMHAVGISDFRALLAATVLAGLRLAFMALCNRRLDGFAAFLMAVFAVGSALPFATGDVRFMLARISIGATVAGLIFLGACMIGWPMSLYAAQRFLRPPVEAKRGGMTCGKLAPHSAAVSG
jgi:hypothetical protein